MISTVRGTRDILPSDVGRWQRLETVARRICREYGYQEIRTPILEREELFFFFQLYKFVFQLILEQ